MKSSKLIKESRTCINCSSTWEVTLKRPSTYKTLFCKECLNKLSKQERQYIYRLHTGNYIEEERKCLNCGRKWKVQVDIRREYKGTRELRFCKDCCKTLTDKVKKRILREKVNGYHDKEKEQRRNSHKRNIIWVMLHRAEERAKKYGYEFNLTKEDIVIPDKCPLLEVPFVLGKKGDYEYTPTIDRIDNNKGYTKDNIQIITKKANSMKNSASFEELKIFCTNILRYSLNNRENESIE